MKKIIFILCVITLVCGACDSYSDEYNNGQINLKQFCDASTNNGTDEMGYMPAVCYKQYGIQSSGAECHMVGKVQKCSPLH